MILAALAGIVLPINAAPMLIQVMDTWEICFKQAVVVDEKDNVKVVNMCWIIAEPPWEQE